MNKDDLIAKVANSVGVSKSDAAKSVDAVLSNITSSLKGGNEVRLVGFGTFIVANRAATTWRNPRTGESIQITAHSSLNQSEPVGKKDQPWFINCAVEVNTSLAPEELLQHLLNIEQQFGRKRKEKSFVFFR